MAARLDLDPASAVLAYLGSELRRHRSAAGLSHAQLGEIVNYTGALVRMIETAECTPTAPRAGHRPSWRDLLQRECQTSKFAVEGYAELNAHSPGMINGCFTTPIHEAHSGGSAHPGRP